MFLKAETPQISHQKNPGDCCVGMAQGFVINSHFHFPYGHPLGNLGFVLIIKETICRLHPFLSHTSILISEQIYQQEAPMSHCIHQINTIIHTATTNLYWNITSWRSPLLFFFPLEDVDFLGLRKMKKINLFQGTSRMASLSSLFSSCDWWFYRIVIKSQNGLGWEGP